MAGEPRQFYGNRCGPEQPRSYLKGFELLQAARVNPLGVVATPASEKVCKKAWEEVSKRESWKEQEQFGGW